MPPRLWPTSVTGAARAGGEALEALLQALGGLPGAVDVRPHRGGADAVAAPAQPRAQQLERAVPRQEAGDEQDGRRLVGAAGPEEHRRAQQARQLQAEAHLAEGRRRHANAIVRARPDARRELGLEDDLDRAVLLLLEHLVRVRRLLQRHVVGGEVVDAERVVVASSSGRMSSIQRFTFAWPMRSWICLSNIVSIGSGSAMPP